MLCPCADQESIKNDQFRGHTLDDSDNWNEDNSRIRTGHGPENMTGLRRFAIGVIKMHGKPVAATVRKLHRTPRLLLDYLKMSANTRPKPAIA